MTLNELNSTLSETVSSGKIGTPVSLRIHLQLPDSQVDLIAALAAVMRVALPLFQTNARTLMARRDSARGQLTALFSLAGGQTVLVTVGRGIVDNGCLHLLLIGNHGTVRLEGAEQFDEESLVFPDGPNPWKSPIEESLSGQAVVELPELQCQ